MRKAILLSILMIGVILTPYASATDGDGDGVNDDVDICPFAAGSATSTAGLGCPDSDGDGLADFEQAITHNWGEAIRENLDYGLSGLGYEIYGLAWATNGSIFYSGGQNNKVHTFDELGNHIGEMYEMPGDIYDIDVSPDGTMLVVTSGNGGCRVINSTTGSLVADLWNNSTNSGVFEVAWSNDGSMIFAGGFDSKLVWFDTSNWSEIRNESILPGWISGIDTTPDDRLLLFSSNKALADNCQNVGERGTSGSCNGKLIVSRQNLLDAISNGTYAVVGPDEDGNDKRYPFAEGGAGEF